MRAGEGVHEGGEGVPVIHLALLKCDFAYSGHPIGPRGNSLVMPWQPVRATDPVQTLPPSMLIEHRLEGGKGKRKFDQYPTSHHNDIPDLSCMATEGSSHHHISPAQSKMMEEPHDCSDQLPQVLRSPQRG